MDLEVHWAGRHPARIGRLHQDAGGTVFFEYDRLWRAGAMELSPIYLPNSTQGSVSTPTPGYGGLHGLFQDALPDWWGERLMQRHFEAKGIPWQRVTALRKLACQGTRKMGALAFLPALDEADFNDSLIVEIETLVEAARQTIHGETGTVLKALLRSGMSPGGAQPKALLAFSADFSAISMVEPTPPGFTPWLVKFDTDPGFPIGRIEAAYADMARAAGIAMPPTRLLEAAGGAHFMVRRFDRDEEGHRLHLHSYSGLTHTPLRDGLDYEDLMDLARNLTNNQASVVELYRRAVFNVIAANDDDHGRNHAFLMDENGLWSLPPAFDVTQASYPLATGFRAARIQGRAADITRRELLALGQSQGIDQPAAIIAQVIAAVTSWPTHAAAHGIPLWVIGPVAAETTGKN